MTEFFNYYLTEGFKWNCLWFFFCNLAAVLIAHFIYYLTHFEEIDSPPISGTELFGFDWMTLEGLWLILWCLFCHFGYVLIQWC